MEERWYAKAAAEIKKPKGKRTHPPDIASTPFGVVATELAERAVREFASSEIRLSIPEWDSLRAAISWRVSHLLYNMAYPPCGQPHKATKTRRR